MGISHRIVALMLVIISPLALASPALDSYASPERVFAGAGNDWSVRGDKLAKSSGDESGIWYHLQIGRDVMRLVMAGGPDIEDTRSFNALSIEDMKIDGKQPMVYKWCLKNQQQHHLYLQQGLDVKMGVCRISGTDGEFRVEVNHQTMAALEQGKRLSFTVRSEISTTEVNFDIENLADAFAVMELETLRAAIRGVSPAAGPIDAIVEESPSTMVVEEVVETCDIAPPADFTDLPEITYVCDDVADRKRAEQKMAIAVNTEKLIREQVAIEQQQVMAEAELKRKQEEALLLKQEQAADASAIDAIEQNSVRIQGEIVQKMIGVCSKMWNQGRHRCYCEKYIKFAPTDIQSKSSCSS